MKRLKENRPLQFALGALLLVFLCCYLPQEILFQSLCMEQDREIPPHTEVLVSACKRPEAKGVPGGEVLFVNEKRTGRIYLLDLRTGEKTKISNAHFLFENGIFLSSDLVWLEGSRGRPDNSPSYRPDYILDLKDGKQYEVLDLSWLPRSENGYLDLQYYSYFKSAERIFIHHSKNIVIALSSDFRTSPNGRVVLSQYALESGADYENGKAIEELIKGFGLRYEIIDISTTLYKDIPSPTGNYLIRNDGIYSSETNLIIVDREYTGGHFMGGYFKSWYYDESAVVVQQNSSYLFISTLGPQFFLIPSPLLVLRLPEL